MTQAELAKKAGVARTAINDLEAGRRNPGLETLLNVAKALRRPLSELIFESEEKLKKRR